MLGVALAGNVTPLRTPKVPNYVAWASLTLKECSDAMLPANTHLPRPLV